MSAAVSSIEERFAVCARGSSVSTEIRAGLTTFLTMSYIIAVNAVVLTGGARLAGQDVSFSAVVTSTCLIAAVMCLAMGLAANTPFALAPGMGVNAVVAYQLMAGLHYTFAEAMGIVFLQGILLTVFVVTGLRQRLLRAIPTALKHAIGAGIGLFLFAIGAFQAGFFVVPLGATAGGTLQPPTAGALGSFTSPPTLLAAFGLIVTGVLMVRGARAAILLGIVLTTVVGFVAQAVWGAPFSAVPGTLVLPPSLVSWPDFSYVGIGLSGLTTWGKAGASTLLAGALAVISIFMSDFFDVAGSFTALGTEAGLADEEGHLRENEGRAYFVDGIASALGGLVGSSSATTFIESGAGIAAGGRTGLTAIVTALPFALAVIFAPLFGVIPQEATAGALMIVGLLMLGTGGDKIPWREYAVGLPAILCLMFMPLTWSITNGIGAGLLTYAILNPRRAGALLWLAALLFAVYFAVGLR